MISWLMITVILLGIAFSSMNFSISQETRKLRILNAPTGSNSISLGSESEPIPLGGYPFIVNITLQGSTNNLFTFQIAVSFNKTLIRCVGASIFPADPRFVFYGKQIVQVSPEIDNELGYIAIGASLLRPDYADVSTGLFCQITFTAVKAGTSLLNLIPTNDLSYPKDTFLWDKNLNLINFDMESFSVITLAGSTPPVALFTFNPSNPIANYNVTFDASASYDPNDEITSYFWDFGDGTNETTTKVAISHNYTSNGTYFVNLTVSDSEGFFNSILKEVQVGQIPYVTFTYEPLEIKLLEPVTFNATGSYAANGKNVDSYVWNFGDGNTTTFSDAIIVHAFSRKGVFWVNLTIYDSEGLHNSTKQEIFVGQKPIANFTFSPTEPRSKSVVTFNASLSQAGEADDSIVLLVWDFGDYNVTQVNITNSNSWVIQHIYLASGWYPVNLTVYDNNGLYNSYVQGLTVKAATTAPDNTYLIVAGAIVIGVIVPAAALVYRKKRRTSHVKLKKKTPSKTRYFWNF